MKPAPGRTRGVFVALLELRLELSLLNHRIAIEFGLNDIDLDCLEVISRQGPTSPAKLVRRLGTHPATMTGVLARLEASGWIERTVDPNDRRASVLKINSKRNTQLRRRYAASTQAVLDAVADRSDNEVIVLVDLLEELAIHIRDSR